MQPIFLLGSERSGSNLLRTLLGNHTQISAPIAPHLCDTFLNQFKNYLPISSGFKTELLSDINKYVNHSFNDWNVKLNLKPNEQLKSFIDFVDFTFSSKAMSEGKSHYFSKDNHNHRYALGILREIPNAKFIHLHRDPRDQVASWMRKPMHLHTPFQAISKWNREQNEILMLRDFYQVDMCTLKYEDLVDQTKSEMTRVLEFLKLNAEKGCFETNKNNQDALKHPLWENLNKPIEKKNYGKYKDVLSETDIRMIEHLANELMNEFGYKKEAPDKWEKGNPYIFNLSERLKVYKSLRKNKNFRENEMLILMDKQNFINDLFSKFNK